MYSPAALKCCALAHLSRMCSVSALASPFAQVGCFQINFQATFQFHGCINYENAFLLLLQRLIKLTPLSIQRRFIVFGAVCRKLLGNFRSLLSISSFLLDKSFFRLLLHFSSIVNEIWFFDLFSSTSCPAKIELQKRLITAQSSQVS